MHIEAFSILHSESVSRRLASEQIHSPIGPVRQSFGGHRLLTPTKTKYLERGRQASEEAERSQAVIDKRLSNLILGRRTSSRVDARYLVRGCAFLFALRCIVLW